MWNHDWRKEIFDMGIDQFKLLYQNEFPEEAKRILVIAKHRDEFERWAHNNGFNKRDEQERRIVFCSGVETFVEMRAGGFEIVWLPWVIRGIAGEEKFLVLARTVLATGIEFKYPDQREAMIKLVQDITKGRHQMKFDNRRLE